MALKHKFPAQNVLKPAQSGHTVFLLRGDVTKAQMILLPADP